MKITGILTKIELVDSGGNVKAVINDTPNLIVYSGKNLIASRLLGNTDSTITHMAIGTSNAPQNLFDTALLSEIYTAEINSESRLANVVTYSAIFGPGQGVGNIVEAGLYNGNSSPILLARTTFGTIPKAAEDTLTINWLITIN